jgi:pilus assembly protein Flp/PilA
MNRIRTSNFARTRRSTIGAIGITSTVRRIEMKLVNCVRSFVRAEEGQDLLEYALLIALIALVAVGAVTAAGSKVSTVFTNIAAQMPTGA